MLLAQKAYAEDGLALVLFSTRLLDDELTVADESLESLRPIYSRC
jgi:hypothetical protein